MTYFGGRHLIVFSLQVKAHMEALQVENDHLSREIAILRETVKVIKESPESFTPHFTPQELEMRIDTQKQTLSARDESIKKLLEMLQTKGEGKEEEARVHQQMQMVAQKQVRRGLSELCTLC